MFRVSLDRKLTVKCIAFVAYSAPRHRATLFVLQRTVEKPRTTGVGTRAQRAGLKRRASPGVVLVKLKSFEGFPELGLICPLMLRPRGPLSSLAHSLPSDETQSRLREVTLIHDTAVKEV